MEDGADERQHHLGARIDAGAAVGLAVDDERIAATADRKRNAALEAVCLPLDEAALRVHPPAKFLWRANRRDPRRARRDAAVPPDGCRTSGAKEEDRHDRKRT